jgi:ribosomal protein S1
MSIIDLNQFHWETYTNGYVGGNKLIKNSKIKKTNLKDKIYSHEIYADELYKKFCINDNFVKKDVDVGDCIQVTNIVLMDNKISLELMGGLFVDFDSTREKKFIQLFGYETIKEFEEVLKSPTSRENFINQKFNVIVIESTPVVRVSLWQGYIESLKKEFLDQIKNPTNVYTAKITEANKGGYFANINGVDAFMPGGQAAPNKLLDFTSLIGKEVKVMIEDYLPEKNSFIISHKKYLEYIIPIKLKELDTSIKYKGTITGTSNYGIFIEFGEIFTGLLHTSKMCPTTLKLFNDRYFRAGMEIEFYIDEIQKDLRIILTEQSPELKLQKNLEFIQKNKDKKIEGKIISIFNSGILIVCDENIVGILPGKYFKNYNMKKYNIGDTILIMFEDYKDNRFSFKPGF